MRIYMMTRATMMVMVMILIAIKMGQRNKVAVDEKNENNNDDIGVGCGLLGNDDEMDGHMMQHSSAMTRHCHLR